MIPSHRTLVRRLLTHYAQADDQTRSEGRTWYDRARLTADILADQYGYHVCQTASVIAALSPNVTWPQNVIAAESACKGHQAGEPHWAWKGAGYGANKAKSSRILSGELEALNGPKVTQFAEGILGNPNACTVDVWMQRAVGCDYGRAPTRLEHRAIRKALESAAHKAGETVRDFQAIVWVQVRDRADGQLRIPESEAA